MNRAIFVLVTVGLVAALGTPAGAAEAGKTEWKTRSELSYVRTTGNTDTQTFAGKIETSADATPNRYFAKAKGLYGKDSGTISTSQWIVAGRYERALSERMFGFLAADYLKDTFGGFDMRVTIGPGVGYDFLTGVVHNLKGLFSVVWVEEDRHAVPEPRDDEESYAAGKIEGKYSWQVNESLRFKQDAGLEVSFEDTNVYFANS